MLIKKERERLAEIENLMNFKFENENDKNEFKDMLRIVKVHYKNRFNIEKTAKIVRKSEATLIDLMETSLYQKALAYYDQYYAEQKYKGISSKKSLVLNLGEIIERAMNEGVIKKTKRKGKNGDTVNEIVEKRTPSPIYLQVAVQALNLLNVITEKDNNEESLEDLEDLKIEI